MSYQLNIIYPKTLDPEKAIFIDHLDYKEIHLKVLTSGLGFLIGSLGAAFILRSSTRRSCALYALGGIMGGFIATCVENAWINCQKKSPLMQTSFPTSEKYCVGSVCSGVILKGLPLIRKAISPAAIVEEVYHEKMTSCEVFKTWIMTHDIHSTPEERQEKIVERLQRGTCHGYAMTLLKLIYADPKRESRSLLVYLASHKGLKEVYYYQMLRDMSYISKENGDSHFNMKAHLLDKFTEGDYYDINTMDWSDEKRVEFQKDFLLMLSLLKEDVLCACIRIDPKKDETSGHCIFFQISSVYRFYDSFEQSTMYEFTSLEEMGLALFDHLNTYKNLGYGIANRGRFEFSFYGPRANSV